jgi:hypothetical protein
MTTSPDFAEHRTDLADWRFATLRQRRQLRQVRGREPELPALPLNRLPTPMLAAGRDGELVYTNLAFATMLGHSATTTLTEQSLPALLAGHSGTPPRDCVTALRAAGNVVIDWLHAEGFPVHTVVSVALPETEWIALISITDISDLMWATPPEPR